MFNQVLGGRSSAADGWGGDTYGVWFDGENVVMVLDYVGDTAEDAAELESALTEYIAATITDETFGSVSRADDRVTFVVASDPDVGALVAETPEG
jgi:hypothetical protein